MPFGMMSGMGRGIGVLYRGARAANGSGGFGVFTPIG